MPPPLPARVNKKSASIEIKEKIARELHRQARKNYDRRHVYVRGFKDLFQADLVEMIPYYKCNNGFRYLLTVIDVFSKYAWAQPLRQKNARDVCAAMREILTSQDGAHLKPPKYLQTDLGKEFYNQQFKDLLSEFNITLYSSFSTKKASVIECFNRTLKTKMWRKFTAQGSYCWINMLDNLLKDYNNSVHRTIKMKPNEVKLSDEERLKTIHNNNHDNKRRGLIKFKIGDYVRISHLKGVFEKGYTPNWSTELFIVTKVCQTLPVTYELSDLNGHPIKGGFYNEELQKTNHRDIYLVEKILKTRGNKVLVKWLGFPTSQSTWETRKNIL